jgi:3-oxoacyl-[acyl-carrier protein] reductase
MIRYSFPNKVVLVTGSSRGMGAAILERFAQAGATCIVNFFDDAADQNRKDAEETAGKLRGHGATVHLLEADVRSFDSVGTLMKRVAELAGGLDILVNNAGICRDKTLKKMTQDEWQSVLDTNLSGVFHCAKHGAEILRDGGRMINISSIAAWAGIHGQANYASAKAGVIALTKVLSRELAKRKITVNAVAPGVIQTPMLGVIKPDVLVEYEKQIPLGRLGRPDDVANAVLFLASEESEYITGQVLPVTGGWH